MLRQKKSASSPTWVERSLRLLYNRILFATFNFPFRLVHTGAEAEGVTKLGRVLMRA